MTNDQLETRLKTLIKRERAITNRILDLITLAEERRLYLARGFATMYDWLTKGLGYSKPAAHRRLSAARLARVVPDVGTRLENGELNLTNLSKVSTAIRASEKVTGLKLDDDQKAELVAAVENQTTDEADATLFQMLPETASALTQERTIRLDEENHRLTTTLSREDLDNIAWARDFLSHAMPDASKSQVISHALKEFRRRNSKSKAKGKRGKTEHRTCEYRDDRTGRVCGSTYQIEEDHIVPRALGGSDDPSNKRWLCRAHNQQAARDVLGKKWAGSWTKRRRREAHPR